MLEEQKTIEFLVNRVKQLELDVQYELHRASVAEQKYEQLYNTVNQVINQLSVSIDNIDKTPTAIG
jgi:hypothetical protein